VTGLPAVLSNVDVDVAVGGGEVRIVHGSAQIGGGSLSLDGHAAIRGLELGEAQAVLVAKGVHLSPADGVDATLDARLNARLAAPSSESGERSLPRVEGDVVLTSFSYTRPIGIAADIGSITQRGKRKLFEGYDPADDLLSFDIRVRAAAPMRIRNNLVDAQLAIDSDALNATGTNQRFGARGQLRILPGGRIRLQSNEFEVRQGTIRFDDATRIAPNVDVLAVTEYRRFSEAQAGTSTAGASAGAGASGVGRTGGSWRITLHAYGDADNLRLEMTSEPALSQEDIVLLLTLGMTRAEVDQLQASALGSTAALEALSALTGADSAVKKAVPVIDDFRFGNAYSSRTGRTEPTVTVGKRVTEQVRANVTSGLAENREIRSTLELRLTPRISVQTSYDNINDVSSSALGNLGADIRWRLEFE
jgi:translocation and assembly module TamB